MKIAIETGSYGKVGGFDFGDEVSGNDLWSAYLAAEGQDKLDLKNTINSINRVGRGICEPIFGPKNDTCIYHVDVSRQKLFDIGIKAGWMNEEERLMLENSLVDGFSNRLFLGALIDAGMVRTLDIQTDNGPQTYWIYEE